MFVGYSRKSLSDDDICKESVCLIMAYLKEELRIDIQSLLHPGGDCAPEEARAGLNVIASGSPALAKPLALTRVTSSFNKLRA